jgi:hypothetical protein
MNLTVGPLPPAVYWRRRAIVIGALLLVVVLLVAMCSGSGSGSKHNAGPRGSTGAGSPTSQPSVVAPIIGDGGDGGGDGGGGDGGGTAPTSDPASPEPDGAPAGGGDQPVASGPCTDADLLVTGVTTALAKGYYFSMKVKNVSGRACSRDVGGGPQALQVVNASGVVVWTSDLCATPGQSPQPDVRTFGPGIETVLPSRPFYWDGTVGRCRGGTSPAAGAYRMVARLGTKASEPVALTGK